MPKSTARWHDGRWAHNRSYRSCRFHYAIGLLRTWRHYGRCTVLEQTKPHSQYSTVPEGSRTGSASPVKPHLRRRAVPVRVAARRQYLLRDCGGWRRSRRTSGAQPRRRRATVVEGAQDGGCSSAQLGKLSSRADVTHVRTRTRKGTDAAGATHRTIVTAFVQGATVRHGGGLALGGYGSSVCSGIDRSARSACRRTWMEYAVCDRACAGARVRVRAGVCL